MKQIFDYCFYWIENGLDLFSDATYGQTGRPHAIDAASVSGCYFPTESQTVDYTCFDKVREVRQGFDTLRYTYGFDRRRVGMEERSGGHVRSKQYVGSCEYVVDVDGGDTTARWWTFLSGPTGVYAVVVTDGQNHTVHYVLKDNLGSWSVVTDGDGNVEQRLGYDAWGNPRDPSTWVNHPASGGFGKPMFDRGFTGHEYLPLFGLVNMNGRVYDPATASFLSPDRYMQDPTSAQGFNRYAYCMNNPLRYVDPSGWKPRQPIVGSTPTSADYFRDIYAYAEKAYEPGDFRNAYYMYNMAFYGNMGGPGGGNAYGGSYFNSYGYYASRCYNSVYNYTSPIALLQDWQNNPSYSTNKSLIEAGIDNITVGELYGSYFGNPGYRNSYYTWTDSDGNIHTAEVLFEHVGGFSNGVFTVSNQPLWMYESRSLSEKVNIIAQSLGVPLGTIENGMECAAKAYYNVPMVKVRSGLTNAQKIAAISKEGLMLSKVTKGLGVAGAAVSTFINGYQTYNYYNNGGTGYDVLVKGLFDVGMVTLGVFGGPIGLGISLGYMVVDLATDGFHVSYEIKP